MQGIFFLLMEVFCVCGDGKGHQIYPRSVEHTDTTQYAFNCNAHKHNAQIFDHNVTNPRVYGICFLTPAGLKNLKIKAKTK